MKTTYCISTKLGWRMDLSPEQTALVLGPNLAKRPKKAKDFFHSLTFFNIARKGTLFNTFVEFLQLTLYTKNVSSY